MSDGRAVICCPLCRGGFEGEGTWRCQSCGAIFEAHEGIPDLTPDAAWYDCETCGERYQALAPCECQKGAVDDQ